MSLRGAQRRGNPFSLQYNIAESSTLDECATVYGFALGAAYCSVLLRDYGLPRLVAQKSAMPCSGQRPEQGKAPLGLISPQRVRGPHALARNDLQKTVAQVQEGVLPGKGIAPSRRYKMDGIRGCRLIGQSHYLQQNRQ